MFNKPADNPGAACRTHRGRRWCLGPLPQAAESAGPEVGCGRHRRPHRALAKGERGEVVRILDRAWIREVREEQSVARPADAYLDTGKDDPPTERLRASSFLDYTIYQP